MTGNCRSQERFTGEGGSVGVGKDSDNSEGSQAVCSPPQPCAFLHPAERMNES